METSSIHTRKSNMRNTEDERKKSHNDLASRGANIMHGGSTGGKRLKVKFPDELAIEKFH